MSISSPLLLASFVVTSFVVTSFAAASPALAQSPAPATKPMVFPEAHVVLQLDSAHAARFTARAFELRVAPGDAGAQIELTKNAGDFTSELVRLSATGSIAPSATIDIVDTLAAPVMTIRLMGISLTSDHVSLSNARAAFEQQRISQQEALSQLTSDYQDAERDLATAEELGKTRGNTRLDLARARDRAALLKQRLDLLKQRQAITTRQLGDAGPLDETIMMRFEHMEIESRETENRAALDFVAKGKRPKP